MLFSVTQFGRDTNIDLSYVSVFVNGVTSYLTVRQTHRQSVDSIAETDIE